MSKLDQTDLEYVFHPRSVAVVGASNEITKAGNGFLGGLRELGIIGRVYPVNLESDEILGLRAYTSVKDIPRPLDYVICCIPAPSVPQLMEDCVASGVKVVHLFTAGFSEMGEDEGARLEAEILGTARKGGIRIIGPNCMGIYSPVTGLTFYPGLSTQSGPVAFISQSGGNAEDVIRMGPLRGIHFSRVVSYNNASDLNESDFLECCAQDAETKIIGAYIEGVKDGRRFLQVLRDAAKAKPVVMLKGGRTEAGARAAASHTGSLAGTDEVWTGLCKQTGVIRVYSLGELLDVMMTFLLLPLPKGLNTALIGEGGGASVIASDDCASAGLSLPPLPPKIRQELSRFIPKAGTSTRNPVDSVVSLQSPSDFHDTIAVVASYELIDLVIVHIGVDWPLLIPGGREGREHLDETVDTLIRAGRACGKPLAIALVTAGAPENWEVVIQLQRRCVEAGFPVYPSIAGAAHAISRFIHYHEKRAGA